MGNQILKEHLIRGYTIYEPRLAQQGLHELQKTVELLHKTLVHHELVNDIGSEVIQLILSYAKTQYVPFWNICPAVLKMPGHIRLKFAH